MASLAARLLPARVTNRALARRLDRLAHRYAARADKIRNSPAARIKRAALNTVADDLRAEARAMRGALA